MAIHKAMRKVLKALSFDGVEVEAARHLADLKGLDPIRIFRHHIDYKIYNGEDQIPVRIFLPGEHVWKKKEAGMQTRPILLFFHGGGWVTESIDNYERVCARMADATDHIVVSVGYRLAPEFKFPIGLEDCYAVAKALYTGQFLQNADPAQITLIGDSAGGNLAAALSLMARDRGEFMPRRQILIYPALSGEYSDTSPYPSVRENGKDYLLTAGKLRDYIQLYAATEKDKMNPYFAPLCAQDYSDQPETLILTAEFDPLRDEGEEYADRLKKAGNEVRFYRLKDALHGYFALGIKYYHVQQSFEYINRFLGKR